MLLRTMSHTSERPAEPQGAPPTPSLNSFVLNHQTQSKHQRRSSHLHPLLKVSMSTVCTGYSSLLLACLKRPHTWAPTGHQLLVTSALQQQ